jgi:hypothetical protein
LPIRGYRKIEDTMMCDKELLVGYVYGDLQDLERQEFERHLASCSECRDEIAGLRVTRTHLASWQPPAPDLGFEVTRSRVITMPRPFRPSPAWGFAAAAVLVLAVASAIANLEIRTGSEGLVIRTGWLRVAPAAVPEPTPVMVASPASSSVEAIERRIAELETSLAALDAREADAAALRAAADGGTQLSDAELLRRVQRVVRDSETRQQRELATRIAQVAREIDALHRADLVRLQQTFAQTQRLTDAEVLQQREMMNQVYRLVATQR